jgi:hypothetical protein
MQRDIKLNKHEIVARACGVKQKEFPVVKRGAEEFEISIITAVDLSGSKALETATNDYGLAVYNELGFGFAISWKSFEDLQEKLKITEEKYEDYLDNFINDFSDTVIDFVKTLKN